MDEGLTHWGRVTHICVGKITIIGSDNGLSPGRRQAIIWTNVGILLIRPLGTNFSEILIGIQTFSFKKMYLKMSSAKWRPFCLGLSVLNHHRRLFGTDPVGIIVWVKYGVDPIWSLQWRHNEHDGISNRQPHDFLLNRVFKRRSKETSKLRVTGLCEGCEGKSSETGEFPTQRANYAENVSIWWRHHESGITYRLINRG